MSDQQELFAPEVKPELFPKPEPLCMDNLSVIVDKDYCEYGEENSVIVIINSDVSAMGAIICNGSIERVSDVAFKDKYGEAAMARVNAAAFIAAADWVENEL